MSRFRLLAVFIFVLPLALAVAQSSDPNSDTSSASSRQSSRRQPVRDGFIDFALKRVNPSDVDYGEKLDVQRRTFVETTIQQPWFWTSATSTMLLLVTFVLWVVEARKRKRHELLAARFLSCYHNELVVARTTALGAVARYEQLHKAFDTSSQSKSLRNASEVPAPAQPSAKTLPIPSRTSLSAAGNHDLVTELNLLRQERLILQNEINNLRQQSIDRKQKSRAAAKPELQPSKQGDSSDVRQGN